MSGNPMTNPHIRQTDTQWVVIARMHNNIKQLFCKEINAKPIAFPSEAAALQFMKAEGWTDDTIAEIFFLPVEDDE